MHFDFVRGVYTSVCSECALICHREHIKGKLTKRVLFAHFLKENCAPQNFGRALL